VPTPTLIVSFHGGGSGENKLKTFPALTNILVEPPKLRELRGFALGPGSDSNHLYVVEAYKDASTIYRFTSADNGTYNSGAVFLQDQLSHPFDAIFGPNGNLYVSNQDSNRITFYEPNNPKAGFFGPIFDTLRGLAWDGTYIYAADEEQGVIGIKPSGGSPLNIAVKKPVHLMYDGARYLYIGSGSGNSIWVWDTTGAIDPNPTQIVGSQTPVIKATAGMALPGDGNLYVASRLGNTILQYPIDVSQNPPKVSNGQALSPGLPDNPEFVGALGMGVYG
jgi:hypothetical protein